MGESFGLIERKIYEFKIVGLLYDIGKIVIEENIFNKFGKFMFDEVKEIRCYLEIGYRILSIVYEILEIV